MADVKIAVEAKQRATVFCPVSVELALPPEKVQGMALVDEQRDAAVPAQVVVVDGRCRLHWILESAAAGQVRNFTLTDAVEAPESPYVDLTELSGKVEIRIGGEFFSYYHSQQYVRPVLYPIIGPFGQGVTRAHPMEEVENDHKDHPHHKSVWVAWGDVNGSDNWSEQEGHGSVVHRGFDDCEGGPVFGCIGTRNDWLDKAGNKLMDDCLVYRIYNLPGSARFVEMDVTFKAGAKDVRFGDTKEGGICSVRVAAPMEADRGGRIENAYGGVNEDETWGKRAPWCDYSGTVGGHRVGICVFDHPSNLRYPTYWHVRNYGLMTANPFGLSQFLAPEKVDGSFVLPAGQSLAFRYAIFVHAGDATEGGVRNRYLDWVFPPKTKVVV